MNKTRKCRLVSIPCNPSSGPEVRLVAVRIAHDGADEIG
jgi:hypothetical protein